MGSLVDIKGNNINCIYEENDIEMLEVFHKLDYKTQLKFIAVLDEKVKFRLSEKTPNGTVDLGYISLKECMDRIKI